MRKFVSALLVIALLAAILVGCTGNSGTQSSSASASASGSASASASASASKSTEASKDAEPEADSEASADASADESVEEAPPAEPENLEPVTLRSSGWWIDAVQPGTLDMYKEIAPHVTVEVITADMTKLMMMMAAGNSPDFHYTVGVTDVPFLMARGIATSLEPYLADYAPNWNAHADEVVGAIGPFLWDAETARQGSGELCGFLFDHSSDMSLVINKSHFDAAGIEYPSTTVPMTYQELGELAKKLAIQKENGEAELIGFNPTGMSPITPRNTLVYCIQKGTSPYSDDWSTADFTNETVMEFMEWGIELMQSGAACVSPIMMPIGNANGWVSFLDGNIAIDQDGYWLLGQMRINENTKDNLDNFMWCPSPQIEGEEYTTYTQTAVGVTMFRASNYKEETVKFIDWWFCGEPAYIRCESGLAGLPMFWSYYDAFPYDSELDKNALDVAMAEEERMTRTIQMNPYIGQGTLDNLFAKYIAPVYATTDGTAPSLEEALTSINNELAPLISEGMEICGVR